MKYPKKDLKRLLRGATIWNAPDTLELIHILKAASENLKQTLNGYVDILSEKESMNVPIEEQDLNDVLDKVLKSINSLIKSSKATTLIIFNCM